MFIIGVVKVNDSKQHFFRNLESAKAWIHQAEQSFGQDADIRGELNLLLAQAELQRVREANRARQWRWKYPLLRHSLALALALLAIIAGFYLWDNKIASQPQTMTTSTEAVAPIAPPPQPMQPPQQAKAPPAVVHPQPVAPPATPGVTAKIDNILPAAQPPRTEQATPSQPEQEIRLSPDEMQKLIRAAGKSLRGQ